MVTTASIARVAALIGDPTRASMLQALMDGRAAPLRAWPASGWIALSRRPGRGPLRSTRMTPPHHRADRRISGAARPPAPSRRTHKRAASGRRPVRVARPDAGHPCSTQAAQVVIEVAVDPMHQMHRKQATSPVKLRAMLMLQPCCVSALIAALS